MALPTVGETPYEFVNRNAVTLHLRSFVGGTKSVGTTRVMRLSAGCIFEVNLAAGSWRLNISASNNRKYARISLYHIQPQLFTSDHGRMEENMIIKNA